MTLLNFPSSPTNNQLYPTTPSPGENQYRWSAAEQTWRLLGAAVGVVPGTYGDAANVGQFTVDFQGRITSAVNVPISLVTPDLQAVTAAGATTTNAIDVASLTAAGLNYPLLDGAPGSVMATNGAGGLGWLQTAEVVTAPTASTDPGATNQIAFGPGFFYFHDGAAWQRVAADATPW